MKFNDVEIKVVDFTAMNAFAVVDGGTEGSGEEI